MDDMIYGHVDKKFFVESEFLSTVIVVIHKSKVEQFKGSYEKITKDVVPRTFMSLNKEDKDGNQLWRVIMLNHSVDEFVLATRKQGYTVRKFVYDEDVYNSE